MQTLTNETTVTLTETSDNGDTTHDIISVVGLVVYIVWLVFDTVIRAWFKHQWTQHSTSTVIGTALACAVYTAACSLDTDNGFDILGPWHWLSFVVIHYIYLYRLCSSNQLGRRRTLMLSAFLCLSTGTMVLYRTGNFFTDNTSCKVVFSFGNIWAWISLYLSLTLWVNLDFNDEDGTVFGWSSAYDSSEQTGRVRLSVFLMAQVAITMISAFGDMCGARIDPSTESILLFVCQTIMLLTMTNAVWTWCVCCKEDDYGW